MQENTRGTIHRFGLVLCAGALMPFVPGLNAGTFIFVFSYFFFLFIGNGFWLDKNAVLIRRAWLIVIFLFLCTFSVIWLINNGGQLDHWARAIIPFLFLLSWFHLPTLRVVECEALAYWLLLATAIWALRILIEAIWLASAGSDVFQVRLTNRIVDSVLPYPLVAITLLIFWGSNLIPKFRLLALMSLIVLYIWIGYRGGLIIVLTLLLLGVLAKIHFTKLFLFALPLSFFVIVIGLNFVDADGVINGLVSRFSSLGEESEGIRALEWKYALMNWLDSPIFGKGLGWQVPADVAFFGIVDPEFEMPENVGYLHSVAAYFLMNLGIIGLLLYLFIIKPCLPKWSGLKKDRLQEACAVALIVLFLFFLTQASFRQIQTTMMIVCLLKINLSMMLFNKRNSIRTT
jgi:O-antigen ligase